MRRFKMLLICLLVLVTMTACGERKQNGSNSEEVQSEQISYEEKTIDLNGTYDQNDLLITAKNEEYEGVTVEIPQIDGLKNTEVQKKINQDMYSKVKTVYKSIPNLEYVIFINPANFANVFSVRVYMGGEAEEDQKQLCLNYNLVNGQPLTFEELFTKDADLLEITRNAFRQMLIKDYMNGNYDENELYKMVKVFQESEEKEFTFSPRGIYIYHGNHTATISMMEYADDITIYSRYATEESLFERNDIGRKELFTCMEVPEDVFEKFEFGYLEENYWRDFACLQEYIDEDDADPQLDAYLDFKEKIYKEIEGRIEKYREEAKQNPNQVYIFLTKPFINRQIETEWVSGEWQESYTGIARVERRIQIFIMPKELFESTYKDILIEAYRYEYFALQGGLHLNPMEGVIVKEMMEEEYYNYVTGERVSYEE